MKRYKDLEYSELSPTPSYIEMKSPELAPISGIQFNVVVYLYGVTSKVGYDFTARVVLESSQGSIIIIDNAPVEHLQVELNQQKELRIKINRVGIFHEVNELYMYHNGVDLSGFTQAFYRMWKVEPETFTEAIYDHSAKGSFDFELFTASGLSNQQ